MFNLLPEQDKKIVIKEYRLRLSATVLFFLLILCVVALISLVPSIVQLYLKEKIILKNTTTLKEEVAKDATDDYLNILKSVKKKAEALGSTALGTYSYEFIDRIIGNRISGIKITGVRVKTLDGSRREVAIFGVARNRDTLLSFAQALEGEKDFAEVSVPASNFASAADINFSILANTK